MSKQQSSRPRRQPHASDREKNDNRKGAARLQYGALPYRVTKTGDIEFLLVTSRETGRWIIPKGWPIAGLEPAEAAAREAYEEAGVRGVVGIRAIGEYAYKKSSGPLAE